jgi:hypothetical protein
MDMMEPDISRKPLSPLGNQQYQLPLSAAVT